MAFVLKDHVRDTTTTTGTGTITLANAPPSGFQAFSAVGNGNTCPYVISDGVNWEVGTGTYSSTGPTLARSVSASSNGGSLVSFAAGTKDVVLATNAAHLTSLAPLASPAFTGTASFTNGSSTPIIDNSPSAFSLVNNGTVDFPSFSGMIIANDHSSGAATIYLVGAGGTTAIGSNGTPVGTMTFTGSAYRFTNNTGATRTFSLTAIRTRAFT